MVSSLPFTLPGNDPLTVVHQAALPCMPMPSTHVMLCRIRHGIAKQGIAAWPELALFTIVGFLQQMMFVWFPNKDI